VWEFDDIDRDEFMKSIDMTNLSTLNVSDSKSTTAPGSVGSSPSPLHHTKDLNVSDSKSTPAPDSAGSK